MDPFLEAAIEEARLGRREGGIPIGSVLVIDNKIIGRGHNRRVQKGSAILHGEMDAIENAGRLPARDYQRGTLYTTLAPCEMCTGTTLLYKIPRVIVGEEQNYPGCVQYLRSQGVEVQVVNSAECIRLLKEFIEEFPQLWNEDIGV
jgi:cytosine deaminase